jgi:hypothetical protein
MLYFLAIAAMASGDMAPCTADDRPAFSPRVRFTSAALDFISPSPDVGVDGHELLEAPFLVRVALHSVLFPRKTSRDRFTNAFCTFTGS